ncbi:MAG: DUF494 domain-containing protein [Calditrichaeota bacterium]|nr:DUF494 domain-containing protein [Calditrichota bacterium]
MEQHIVEILVILMRAYPEGDIRPDDFEPLANNLISLGYTQNEIETALFWFYNRVEYRRSTVKPDGLSETSFRCLNDYEKMVLTPEAYGYLIELNHLGLLTLGEMDTIIERAVVMGGNRVDADDIKLFIAAHISDPSEGGLLSSDNPILRNSGDKYH